MHTYLRCYPPSSLHSSVSSLVICSDPVAIRVIFSSRFAIKFIPVAPETGDARTARRIRVPKCRFRNKNSAMNKNFTIRDVSRMLPSGNRCDARDEVDIQIYISGSCKNNGRFDGSNRSSKVSLERYERRRTFLFYLPARIRSDLPHSHEFHRR